MGQSLCKKRILIVGGTQGIGLAIAKLANKEGAKLLIASRNATKKQEGIKKVLKNKVEAFDLDITLDKDVIELVKGIGKISHLIFTIRPEIESGPINKINIEKVKTAFETKFWGPYKLIQEMLKKNKIKESIIMTSGIAGEKIYKHFSTMSIINKAIETLCCSLALEIGPIRINTISPGFVAPKSKEVEEYAKQFPLPKIAKADEVAKEYINLMTNSYITGTTLIIDGGARLV